MSAADYSALVAAVARRKTRIPRASAADLDAAWRASALLDFLVRLQLLPYRNALVDLPGRRRIHARLR
ncbi:MULTISPECIES: hypothetical protein [unclassified Streptomyces]|uniref:hypothetical protein n=1 Tax=unclassified Streptomyces TaxID=2593676 RepID=UPI001EF0CBB4|nr:MULTISPECIES: hypothetical protein [unclassified Streptomyces]